jgi:hypothetical protein
MPKVDYAQMNKGTTMMIDMNSPDPCGWEQAELCEDSDEWIKAGLVEMENHKSNKTWILVDRKKAQGKKIYKERPVFKRKWLPPNLDHPKGELDKHKVRITIAAYKRSLKEGVDFREKYAATPKWNSIRLLFAIIAYLDLEMNLTDIVAFFLTANLEEGEDIFMEQPERFSDGTDRICKILRSMYGLPQASYHAQKKLVGKFLAAGFKQCKNDRMVFAKFNEDDTLKAVMSPHVDDITSGGSIEGLQDVQETLRREYNITTQPNPTLITGVQIERVREKRWLKIHQEGYVLKLLEQEGMLDSNKEHTPITKDIVSVKRPTVEQANATATPQDLAARKKFQNIFGMLMWLAVHTRPDLSFCCNFFARWLQVAGQTQLNWIRGRPLRYLNGTRNYGLVFQAGNNFDLDAASDSDFAGDISTSRTTVGTTMKIGEHGTFSYSSHLERKVFSSVGQSETHAAVVVSKTEEWASSMLEELHFKKTKPTPVYIDNSGVVTQAVEPLNHSSAKHYRVNQAVLRQKHDDGVLFITKVESNDNRSDFFTKALERALFEKHRLAVMGPQAKPNVN